MLAFCVIMMGAYTRLSDAGLSCPDWPNCYGFAWVSDAVDARKVVEAAYPERRLKKVKRGLK